MSLILDALNRAEQERREDPAAPSPQAPHATVLPTVEPTVSLRRMLPLLIIVMVLTAAMALLWRTLLGDEPTVPESVSAAPAPTVVNAASEPVIPVRAETQALSDKARLVEKLPEQKLSEEKLPVEQPPVETRTVETGVVETVAVPESSTAPSSEQVAIASLYARGAADSSAAAGVVPALQTPATDTYATPEPLEPTGAAAALPVEQNSQPFLHELPQRLQQEIPSIDYSAHVYAEQTGTGVVTFNGRRLRAGDEALPGLRVVAISSEFVLLDWRGTQFRLAALSSWINFR